MADRREVNEADLGWFAERDQPLNDAIEKGYYDEEMRLHLEYSISDMETKNPAAVALGRLGGLASKGKTSEAKKKASRENGKLGGWPKGKPRKQKDIRDVQSGTES